MESETECPDALAPFHEHDNLVQFAGHLEIAGFFVQDSWSQPCTVKQVYVLEDGSEVDLDLGNYERFLDVTLASNHNITSGKIFDQVIKRERTGESARRRIASAPAGRSDAVGADHSSEKT